MGITELRAWWDRQCNWEYYATLDLIQRVVPPQQITVLGATKRPGVEPTCQIAQQGAAVPDQTSAERIAALEQQVALQRVAIAALTRDTGPKLMPDETAATGPIQSILLNHSAKTHHATITLTQPGGAIQTLDLQNVRMAEVKVTRAVPDTSWASSGPAWVLPQKRTVTITLELP